MTRTASVMLGIFALSLAPLQSAGSAPARSAGPRSEALTPNLFLAVTTRNPAGVKAVLKRGADPNARNFLTMTPLIVAAGAGEVETVRALLAAGARVNAPSQFGSALTMATMAGHAPIARLLLARGASVQPDRRDGITPLMLAARSGHADLVGELLDRKAKVNGADNDGMTALMYAARFGHTAVLSVLLDRGATLDAADKHGWTALTFAAVNGQADAARLLLEKGANVNARDKQGRTPLLLTATYSDQPDVVRALLERGADPEAQDGKGRTAMALAQARGYTETAQALQDRTAATAGGAKQISLGGTRSPREAVNASLPLLERSMRSFFERTGCASCHQEGLGPMVTGLAKKRGFSIDTRLAQDQKKRVMRDFEGMRALLLNAVKDPQAVKHVPLAEIKEVTPGFGFLFTGLTAQSQPPNQALSAAALVLGRQQTQEGYWDFMFLREPMQSSFFTMTALALQALNNYGPRDRAAEVTERIRRAKGWLLSATAENTEDKAFRLLGLKWASTSLAERRAAVDALRAGQRPDGGWAQLPGLKSDAYATGQALFALHLAGAVPVTDPVYQRGVQFLLRTQEEDGSWFVSKRAMPANNYFDSGFPHGQSQYSSFNATCWATMALLFAADPPAAGQQTASR